MYFKNTQTFVSKQGCFFFVVNFHHLATRKKGLWTVQGFFAKDFFGKQMAQSWHNLREKSEILPIIIPTHHIFGTPQILQKHGVTSDGY